MRGHRTVGEGARHPARPRPAARFRHGAQAFALAGIQAFVKGDPAVAHGAAVLVERVVQVVFALRPGAQRRLRRIGRAGGIGLSLLADKARPQFQCMRMRLARAAARAACQRAVCAGVSASASRSESGEPGRPGPAVAGAPVCSAWAGKASAHAAHSAASDTRARIEGNKRGNKACGWVMGISVEVLRGEARAADTMQMAQA
ncbi:hypothetical protein ACU4HD_21065 [Cupriavidus basilensis]